MLFNSRVLKWAIGFWLVISFVNAQAAVLLPWQVAINFGASLPSKAKNTLIGDDSGLPASNYLAASEKTNLVTEITAAYSYLLANHVTRIGLAYNFGSTQQASGVIDEFGFPGFENYNYHYSIHRQTLLATAEWNILPRAYRIQPFLLAGLGFSNNTASSYTQDAVPNVVPINNPADYSNHTQNELAFEFSLGASYRLNDAWQVNAKYVYLNAGSVALGTGVYGASGPKQTLQYNTLLAGVAYNF